MKFFLEDLNNTSNYNLILNCIKDGELHDQDLPIIYRLFYDKQFSEFHTLKNELLNSVKKYPQIFDVDLFCTAFNITFKQAENFLKTEKKISFFPIVKNSMVKLSKTFLYKTNDKNFPLTFPNNSEEIKDSLKKIYKAANKSFFVSFDSDPFTDISPSLSVAGGLLVDESILSQFIFTGVVYENGEVGEVGFLKEKEDFSKKQKKLFISFKQVKNINELTKLNTEEINLPYIQLFAKHKNQLIKDFRYFEKLLSPTDKVYLNVIKSETLSLFKEDTVANEINQWDFYLKKFVENVYYLDSLPFNINLRFLCSLSAFAFAMGVIIGAKRKLSIYHFQDDKLYEIFDFINNSGRIIKTKLSEFQNISINISNMGYETEVGIMIYIASHDPGESAKKFILNELQCNLIEINLIDNLGNVPIENNDLWIRIVREIYTLIDEADEFLGKRIDKYHFIFSCPVSIAFCLGMALGDYKKMAVYNFDKPSSSYKKVLDSDASKYFKNFF